MYIKININLEGSQTVNITLNVTGTVHVSKQRRKIYKHCTGITALCQLTFSVLFYEDSIHTESGKLHSIGIKRFTHN